MLLPSCYTTFFSFVVGHDLFYKLASGCITASGTRMKISNDHASTDGGMGVNTLVTTINAQVIASTSDLVFEICRCVSE